MNTDIKLSDLFEFDGKTTDDSSIFYEAIKDAHNSFECHKKTIELLIGALWQSSKRQRGVEVASNGELEKVLNYVPQELKYPLVQVLFEQCQFSACKERNRFRLKTSPEGEEKLDQSVKQVRITEYSARYNNLRQAYESVKWNNNKKNFPEPINLEGSTKINSEILGKRFQSFIEWIDGTNPHIIFLNSTIANNNYKEIINSIFSEKNNAEYINIKGFIFAFLEIINRKHQLRIENKHFRSEFLKIFVSKLGNKNQYFENFKKFYDKSKKDIPQNSPRLIEKIRNMVDTDKVFNETIQILKYTSDELSKIDNSAMLSCLKEACEVMLHNYREDCETLESWKAELEEPAPLDIPADFAAQLLRAACSCLSSIPLKPKDSAFAKGEIKQVRLFSFTDFNALNEKPKAGSGDVKYLDRDPEERGAPFGRPLYGVFTPGDEKPYIQFFNVNTAQSTGGPFYFLDHGSPTRVLTTGTDDDKPLCFDFRAGTLNGKAVGGKKRLREESEASDTSNLLESKSLKPFWDDIRKKTIWTRINGSRTYDVVYETPWTAGSNAIRPRLLWRLPSGGRLARADHVDPDLYLWSWPGKTAGYEKLPKLLGLSDKRDINSTPNQYKKTYKDVKIGNILYSFLEFTYGDGNVKDTYVLTNTPSLNLPAIVDEALSKFRAPTSLNADGEKIRKIFNFQYYRKVYDGGSDQDLKVVKHIKKDGSSKRPAVGDGVDIKEGDTDTRKIGIGLPITFHGVSNIAALRKSSGQDHPFKGKLKNKGNHLSRSAGPRKDAGAVMKDLEGALQQAPAIKSSFPATVFGNWALAHSPNDALKNWSATKATTRKTLPVNQEWCHLRGHGDGGTEHLGNFVSGSYHCNTEQLAIEQGQRQTTHLKPNAYSLRTTAYLFNDGGKLIRKDVNYLQGDVVHKEMKNLYDNIKKKMNENLSDHSTSGNTAPFAAFIRYKIYQEESDNKHTKIFDHLFEGQSEFIDVHQFEILFQAVRFTLAGEEKLKEWCQPEA